MVFWWTGRYGILGASSILGCESDPGDITGDAAFKLHAITIRNDAVLALHTIDSGSSTGLQSSFCRARRCCTINALMFGDVIAWPLAAQRSRYVETHIWLTFARHKSREHNINLDFALAHLTNPFAT
jgi:hypothetical protein